jgi:hypothetical protein
MRLVNGVVCLSMREHHATVASARERVEPYFRSWEVSAALQYGGRPEYRFVFEDAEIIDSIPHFHLHPVARKPSNVRLWRSRRQYRVLRYTLLAGATLILPMSSVFPRMLRLCGPFMMLIVRGTTGCCPWPIRP